MLDPEQKAASEFYRGPALVLAGPGAGKTYVLVERLLHLTGARGVSPDKILVLTFTRAAALHMEKRFLERSGNPGTGITFGTFHSVFYYILKKRYSFKGETILSGGDHERLIRRCAALAGIDVEWDPSVLTQLARGLSYIKNTGTRPEDYAPVGVENQEFLKFAEYYEREKKRMGRIDFDDMLTGTKSLLTSERDTLNYWRGRYKFILIDEVQDMNSLQFDIIKMIAEPSNNIFAVGDDDQSIYSFRGADPGIMLGFRDIYPDAEVIQLKYNYRSLKNIVEGSNCLVSHNKIRYDKQISSARGGGGTIRFIHAQSERDEAEKIAMDIRRDRDNCGEIAILYRTNRQNSQIIKALKGFGENFSVRSMRGGIFDSFIVRDIEAYIALSAGGLKRDGLLRVLNRPERFLARGLLDETVIDPERWLSYYAGDRETTAAIKKLLRDIDNLGRFSSLVSVRYILNVIGYERYIDSERKKDRISEGREQEVLSEIVKLAEKYPRKRDFLREIEEKRETERQVEEEKTEKNSIRLMSFHGSKGLEFDRVYILNANEGITPAYQALEKEVDDSLLEEERRMFYVAVTRARDEVVIADVSKKPDGSMCPSRFIDELIKKSMNYRS